MNSWLPTDFMTFRRAGWPLLWLVVTAMTVAYIWRMKDKGKTYKVIWTAVVILVPFLGIGIWLLLGYRS